MKNHVEPYFSAVMNGHTVVLTGKTQPFESSRSTSLDIDVKNIDVPFYLRYVPVKMNFKLAEARLDARLQLNFIMPEKKSPHLQITGQAALRKLALDDLRGNKILRIPSLTVNLASVEPLVPHVHLSQIVLDNPQLLIRRDKKGNINLLNLVGQDKNPNRRPPGRNRLIKPARKKNSTC